MNVNLQFRSELAREQKITRYEAMNLIADRARAVAGMSDCTFMGIDKRGATFCVVVHNSPESVLTPYKSFTWESVIDSPSEIVTWARETRQMYTPDTWPTILANVSSAWFGN